MSLEGGVGTPPKTLLLHCKTFLYALNMIVHFQSLCFCILGEGDACQANLIKKGPGDMHHFLLSNAHVGFCLIFLQALDNLIEKHNQLQDAAQKGIVYVQN